MPNSNAASDHEAALRQRLQTLLAGHPQAEIARKTATSPANVNRYLRKNRIPASFCAALVQGLDVNPAWLLAGEGSPFLSDVAAGNEKLAGNLLELVQAMSNVARMRLGSLGGRRGQVVLRQLNDALAAHENLKQKLNQHSRHIFGQVLKDWKAALAAQDEPGANALEKAAAQVARLCDDEALELEHLRVQARHVHRFGDLARLPGLQRRAFFRTLGDQLDEAAFAEAQLLVHALESTGRSAEAERLLRALIALAEGLARDGNPWPGMARLMALHGSQLILLRRLADGMARIHQAVAAGAPRDGVLMMLQLGYCFAGTLSFEQFKVGAARQETRADWMVRFALFSEDPQQLEAATRAYEEARRGMTTTARVEPSIARILLRAIHHRDAACLNEYQQLIARSEFLHPERAPWNISLADWGCSIARHCGQHGAALAQLRAADAALAATPADIALPILVEAAHYRNALFLAGASPRQPDLAAMRRRGQEFLARSLAQGYGFLAPLAQAHGVTC